MLTEDYILRMINQALAVLRIALRLKITGQFEESLLTFDQAIKSLLGLNTNLTKKPSDSNLLDMLTFQGTLDVERTLVLADIYREQAEVYLLLEQTENHQFAA